MARAAVFVDRDGVICENRDDYVKSPAEFVLIPGAASALSSITRAGVPLFVITNQSAVGRGILSSAALADIHTLMLDALLSEGAAVEAIMVCPHPPADGCACRKPAPGMLRQIMGYYGVAPERTLFVGNTASDRGAADAARTRYADAREIFRRNA